MPHELLEGDVVLDGGEPRLATYADVRAGTLSFERDVLLPFPVAGALLPAHAVGVDLASAVRRLGDAPFDAWGLRAEYRPLVVEAEEM